METTEHFKNREDGFAEVRKSILIKSLPVMILSAIVGVAMGLLRVDNPTPLIVYPFVLIIVSIAIGIWLNIGIKRRKDLYESYQLTIDGQTITREQNIPLRSQYPFRTLRR